MAVCHDGYITIFDRRSDEIEAVQVRDRQLRSCRQFSDPGRSLSAKQTVAKQKEQKASRSQTAIDQALACIFDT